MSDTQDLALPLIYTRLLSGDSHIETVENIGNAIGKLHGLKGVIIQFWTPTRMVSSGLLLSTSNQPFAPRDPQPHLLNYRLTCKEYQYCSSSFGDDDDHINASSSSSRSKSKIISNGLVGDAFQGTSPKVVKDLSVHKGEPLVDCALKCGLTSVLMPCFSVNACSGVVECCLINPAHLSGILNLLKLAFQNVHLKWPTLQSISDLKNDYPEPEIDDALKTVCETHNLALGQVWISSKLPTTQDCHPYMRPSFVVRLFGYRNDDFDDDAIKAYYDICSLPFQKKQTPPGRALEMKKPYFMPSMLCGSTSCSCFVICLNNYHHPCRRYAFEFIWPQRKNYLKLLESVLLTLEMCLPSFRLSPGLVKLGGELSVLNVDDFITGHVSGCFDVFKHNRFSGIPVKPSDKESTSSNHEVNQLDQSTVRDAVTNTNAQGLPPEPGDIVPQHFFTDVSMDVFVMKKSCTFVLPDDKQHTLASVKKLIETEFSLFPNRYKMTFEGKGEPISLQSEKDFEDFKDHLKETRTRWFSVRVKPMRKKKDSKVI